MEARTVHSKLEHRIFLKTKAWCVRHEVMEPLVFEDGLSDPTTSPILEHVDEDVTSRGIALRASLNKFLQKAKAHEYGRDRDRVLAGEVRLTSLAWDTIPSIAVGHAELVARAPGQQLLLFRGQGLPRAVPIVGRGLWVGCGQLVVSGLRGESGSFGYMWRRSGFAFAFFSGSTTHKPNDCATTLGCEYSCEPAADSFFITRGRRCSLGCIVLDNMITGVLVLLGVQCVRGSFCGQHG